jgi:hypothetical protein
MDRMTTHSSPNHSLLSLDPSHLLGVAGGELILRVHLNGQDHQLVRVTAAKCTIGSAGECTVKLPAGEVGPVHCVILRGRDLTVIRRWSENTWLNGESFVDAPLCPGDTIQIARNRIDVLADTRPLSRNDDVGSPPDDDLVFPTGFTPSGEPSAASSHPALPEQLIRLGNRLRAAESRVASLQSELHESRSAAGALQQRIQHVEETLDATSQRALLPVLERLRRENEHLRQSLESRIADHAGERRQWECEQERLQAELARLCDRLQAESRRVDHDLRELAERQSEVEVARAALMERVAEQTAELEAARGEFVEDQRRWQQQRDEMARHELETLRQREAELEGRAAVLAERHEQLEAAATRLDEERARLLAEQQRQREENYGETLQQKDALIQELQQRIADQQAEWEARDDDRRRQLNDARDLEQHLSEREAWWSRQETEYQQQVADLQEQLRQLTAAAEQRQAEHQRQLDAYDAARTQEEAHRSVLQSQLDAQECESRRREQALQQRAEELENRLADLEQQLHQATAAAANALPSEQLAGRNGASSADPRSDREPWRQAWVEREAALEQQIAELRNDQVHFHEQRAAWERERAELLEHFEKEIQNLLTGDDLTPSSAIGRHDELFDTSDKGFGEEVFRSRAAVEAPSDIDAPTADAPLTDHCLRAEDVVSETPRSTQDQLLAELRAMVDEQIQSPPDNARTGDETIPVNKPAGTDEDLSIEAYMQQLLMRVGGQTAPAEQRLAPQDPATLPTDDKSTVVLDSVSPPSVAAATDHKPEGPLPLPRPRTEQIPNLQAMRDLANQSARSAIHEHVKQRNEMTALTRLGSTLITALAGAILLVLSRGKLSILSVGGGFSLALSVYFAYQTIRTGVLSLIIPPQHLKPRSSTLLAADQDDSNSEADDTEWPREPSGGELTDDSASFTNHPEPPAVAGPTASERVDDDGDWPDGGASNEPPRDTDLKLANPL